MTDSHRSSAFESSRLRISPLPPLSAAKDRVLLEAFLPDGRRCQASSEFVMHVTRDEVDDLHWYYETYLQFDEEPAPTIAARVERTLRERGEELFTAVFEANAEARELWAVLCPHLATTDFELVGGPGVGTAVHWEFLREPGSTDPLSLVMRSFVRVPRDTSRQSTHEAPNRQLPLRVLLAIERPRGSNDVPYRSVATGLVDAALGNGISIDVVRPPGFDRLAAMLLEAARAGRPYDILHFDGHGVFTDRGPRPGPCGYLVFEDRQSPSGSRLIDGHDIGSLMADAGTPTLVLNACRSAYASPGAPRSQVHGSANGVVTIGSFAEDAIRAGASHVLAMRYNVFVDTATRFMSATYRALAKGMSIGAAVIAGRRDLAQRPERRIGTSGVALQDWVVPAHYRADGIVEPSSPDTSSFEAVVSSPSATVSIGRHEIIYRIDRAFDHVQCVVLWGPAGIGKSTTAREFASWYQRTGGATTEYTSLEHQALHTDQPRDDLARLLDDIASRTITSRGLWVVDGVDGLDAAEAGLVAAAMRTVMTAGARVLVTVRNGPAWRAPGVMGVFLPPLDQAESTEFAATLLRQSQAAGVGTRTLLQCCGGNPQVLRLIVTLVARESTLTSPVADQLAEELMSGRVDLDVPGREALRELVEQLRKALPGADSLRADLLATLYLFRGFASMAAVGSMGEGAEGLQAIAEATREQRADMFDRLAAAGLAQDYGHGAYGLHPLLPQVLQPMFARHYPPGSETARRLRAAFCASLSRGGSLLIERHNGGAAGALDMLVELGPSLAAAWTMVQHQGSWEHAASLFAARAVTAYETAQFAQLERLLDEAASVFCEPSTSAPLDGRRSGWALWVDNRARLLRRHRQWSAADAFLTGALNHLRSLVGEVGLEDIRSWPRERQADAYQLVGLLYQHGVVKQALLDPDASKLLDEAAALAPRVGRPRLAAAAEVAKAAMRAVDAIPDVASDTELQQAMRDPSPAVAAMAWMTRGGAQVDAASKLIDENAAFSDALQERVQSLLRSARGAFREALSITPSHLAKQRAEAHLLLGQVALRLLDWNGASVDLAKALEQFEAMNQWSDAAAARVSLAILMRATGRLERAAIYLAPALDYYRAHEPARAAALAADFAEVLALSREGGAI